jgi:hypothetical protein
MKKTFLFLILIFVFIAGCSPPPIIEKKADGRSWRVWITTYRYQMNGDYLGKYMIDTSHDWNTTVVSTAYGSGDVPDLSTLTDCPTTKPANPNYGDEYCDINGPWYFLSFGGKNGSVSEEVWRNYTPETIYLIQEYKYSVEVLSIKN